MPQTTTMAPLVGRERPMNELIEALDSAIENHGGLVLLAGEAGIGKTRLSEEIKTISQDRGARTVRGTCYEGGAAPPFWPWVQLIRALMTDSPDEVASALESRSSVISEIVPEVMPRRPKVEDTVAIDPALARFRLFETIASFLYQMASSRPMILMLDDLHWADSSSLELLEFVARDVSTKSILIVGGYRDTELSRKHPLSGSLASLARVHGFQRIHLRGLESQDVGRIVESAVGVSVPANIVNQIHSRTDGNPFFVSEVARDLAKEVKDRGGTIGEITFSVPDGVREAVGIRLNKLSDECNLILITAAIIGSEFDFELLAALLSDTSEDSLLDRLEEASTVGAVREVLTRDGRYEFTHALVRETLADEMTAIRRARIHTRIISTIEQLYPNRLKEHASVLAYHCAKAESTVGEEKIIRYSSMAGEQAISAYAWIDARTYFEQAQKALGDLKRDNERAAILSGLGRAELFTLTYPHIQRGWDHIAEAFELYDGLEDSESAIKVVVQSGGYPPIWIHNTVDVLSRALQIVAPNSVAEGILLVRHASAVRYEWMDHGGYIKDVVRASGIATRSGNKLLECIAIRAMSWISESEGDYAGAIELRRTALELARKTDQPIEELWCLIGLLEAEISIGNTAAAKTYLEACLKLGERFNYYAVALHDQYLLAYILGDLTETKRLGKLLESAHSDDSVNKLYVAIGAWYLNEIPDIEDRFAAAQLEALNAPSLWQRTGNVGFIAVAARIMNRSEDAIQAGVVAKSILSNLPLIPELERRARIAVGLASVEIGDAAEAKEQYQRLSKDVRGTFPYFLAFSGDRLLGLLAETSGMHDQADTHFQDALKFCGEAGYRIEAAWTGYDYAGVLINRARASKGSLTPQAIQKIELQLDNALNVAKEVGSRPLEQRVISLSEKAAELIAPPDQNIRDLTSREIEVLKLLGAGNTNKQIADELVIALNTAITHVGNILSKTGSANRVEAALYAAKHDLM